ncbi:MAG: beta-galactosidase [Deltaproteobacteria bacterium]|nr:beta-galactosidase [Deltaproteobacteria bacterium]
MHCMARVILAGLLLSSAKATSDVGDNGVGMNIHVGRQGFIDACRDLGVGWVRMDANWFVLEPARDQYAWESLRTWIDRARTAGLKVFLTLGYTPEWVARHGDTDGEFINDPFSDPADWTDFVDDAVRELCPLGVTHYGIWNEPNLGGFYEGTLDEYVSTVLLPGAQAVRDACQAAGCSGCKVLGPDLANVGDVDEYLDGVLARIPAGTFDIIAHHIYQDFAETGWHIWDGDSFINVLDRQRLPWTREPLRQILDLHGYTGEVWITETGYRAYPPGDAAEEDLQATYVVRVLEEQLARAWYTHSFIYEMLDCGIDQPECTIDGFGLMRPTSGLPPDRVFPDDYDRKPAYWALRDFIAAHPEITGIEPPPACGDGQDNDADGRTDMDDRGCADGLDDDESDDPPRLRLSVYRSAGIEVDGELADWGPEGWIALGPESWVGAEALGTGDLEVRAALRWTPQGLFAAVEVEDDIHDNVHAPAELWVGDSLQLAFDVGQSGGSGYDAVDDHEINFALAAGEQRAYRYHGPDGVADDWEMQVRRAGPITRYELRLAGRSLPALSLRAGTVAGFSFLVNDADGQGRVGWKEWTPGIGMRKEPELFGEIALLAELDQPEPDGGPTDGGSDGGGIDAGVDGGGADSGSDGGGLDDGSAGDSGSADGGDPATGDRSQPDAGEPAPDEDGCGCSPGAAPDPTWLAALLFVALARCRRRP